MIIVDNQEYTTIGLLMLVLNFGVRVPLWELLYKTRLLFKMYTGPSSMFSKRHDLTGLCKTCANIRLDCMLKRAAQYF